MDSTAAKKSLLIKSPAFKEPIEFGWQEPTPNTNVINDIKQIIKWACEDMPELSSVPARIDMMQVNANNYLEATIICDYFNKAVDELNKMVTIKKNLK